jgi:SulP family sulfate permease
MDGSLFFGAVDHFAQEMRAITRHFSEQAHILLVGNGINFIDSAGCEALAQEAHRLHLSGRKLYLCSLKGEVMDVLRRGECIKGIGEQYIFRSKIEAIEKIVPLLDPERCRVCTARIFAECAKMPGAKPRSS